MFNIIVGELLNIANLNGIYPIIFLLVQIYRLKFVYKNKCKRILIGIIPENFKCFLLNKNLL